MLTRRSAAASGATPPDRELAWQLGAWALWRGLVGSILLGLEGTCGGGSGLC